MKRFCILLVLLVIITSLAGCTPIKTGENTTTAPENTQAAEATDAPATDVPATDVPATEDASTPVPATTPPNIPAPFGNQPDPQPKAMEDFTVETIDGGTYTLSEALKKYELVVINLFATWCGPCRVEFPHMQKVWSEYSDKVSVVAVSVEANDTVEALTEYANGLGLGFPVAREGSSHLSQFVTIGIPTTVLVDRYGNIVAVEIGSKTSEEEFRELFDRYIGDDYDPNSCTYTIYAYDNRNRDVAGVVVNFCTDTMCSPVVTDEEGTAYFEGVPSKYHVQVIGIPEGYELESSSEFYTDPYSQIIFIELSVKR